MKRILFKKNAFPYVSGDIAGFDDEEADLRVKGGEADYCDVEPADAPAAPTGNSPKRGRKK